MWPILAATALLYGAEEAAEQPLKTHTELSYLSSSGNTETTALAFEFKGEKHWGRRTVRATAFAYLSEESGVESKNQWGLELNYDWELTQKLAFNYMAAYKEDKFSGFDYQFNTGPGLVHKTVRTQAHALTLQGNLLYAVDKRETGETDTYASFKAGLLYEWKILENLKFIEEANIRTQLTDLGNYFVYSKSSVQSKINSMLSMGVSYKVDYVNHPVEGKTSTDKTLLASLIIDY
jgi:putative salt-induced outer membrane protein